MKPTYTPGPWAVVRGDGWNLITAGGKAGPIVANVNDESCPDALSIPAFVQMPGDANARLIALAPEMADAIVEWRAGISESIPVCRNFTQMLELAARIREIKGLEPMP